MWFVDVHFAPRSIGEQTHALLFFGRARHGADGKLPLMKFSFFLDKRLRFAYNSIRVKVFKVVGKLDPGGFEKFLAFLFVSTRRKH